MPCKITPLKTEKTDDSVRLLPTGDILASTVEGLREAMQEAIRGVRTAVVLDLGTTKQIDSLGITLILGLFKSCQKEGLAFAIEGANADLMRVFRLFNLVKFFPITEAGRE